MGFFTIIMFALVVLAIIGIGAGAFFGAVGQGIKNSIQFVEESPTLKNLSDETQNFVQKQAGSIMNEIDGGT